MGWGAVRATVMCAQGLRQRGFCRRGKCAVRADQGQWFQRIADLALQDVAPSIQRAGQGAEVAPEIAQAGQMRARTPCGQVVGHDIGGIE